MTLNEYREAKKDPQLATKLRAKRLLEWAISERRLVAMVKTAFDTINIPAKELIYGFAADRKGFNLLPPSDFKDRFVNMEFISSLFPMTPRPDHWSDSNTLNYSPPLFAVLAKKGENVYQILEKFKRSDLGLLRSDLFSLRDRELEKRIAFKLFSFGEPDQALQFLRDIKNSSTYHQMRFQTKYLYCALLAKANQINSEANFCQKVLQEQQSLQKKNK